MKRNRAETVFGPSVFGLQAEARACGDCTEAERLDFQFTYAFQPIVDLQSKQIYAHEALVRGPMGEPAPAVLAQVTENNRYRFDQACRSKAIKMAAQLGMASRLSINFMPNAIYRPELCIQATLRAARDNNFPVDRIIFETVEGEEINDAKWLAEVLIAYQRIGFLTAIDDFGAGFAGLNLLADFQPDLVKLDMGLIRHIDQRPPRQAIARAVTRMCHELGILVIAEGVETLAECQFLADLGITLMQGYLFSRPLFQSVGQVEHMAWSDAVVAATPAH